MVEEEKQQDHEVSSTDNRTTEEWLSHAQALVPVALERAKQVNGFQLRWKMIISKLERVPLCLSGLSSHPCFSKNTLCKEQLEAVSRTLNDAVELADKCIEEKYEGKLRMQSDLDSLSGKLDLNLKDCGLLIKTGVLSEASLCSSSSPSTSSATSSSESSSSSSSEINNVRELLARLQIGHLEAKHKALDTLVEIMKEEEKNVLSVLGRSNVAALVQLLTAGSPRIREKTAAVICSLAESGSCEHWLVSEGVLPPLIRLVESGGAVGREKAVIALQRLSMSPETARAVVGHGGVRPLVDVCRAGDSVSQAAAACVLKNVSVVPEVRLALAEEGVVRIMVDLLDHGLLLGAREYAAECLRNMTAGNEALRRAVVAEGGVPGLLAYLDGPLPQEPGMAALRNLIGSVPFDTLEALGFLPRVAHVLASGSPGAQAAAASTVVKICEGSGAEAAKRAVGEAGCVPLLVAVLGGKSSCMAREAAAQALASLIALTHNRREVKRDEKSVPNLVQLLDPNPQNTAKKYAVTCLVALSSSKKCKKLMVSYGAIGYLKKLTDMDVPGAKKLLERLERGRLKSLFTRK